MTTFVFAEILPFVGAESASAQEIGEALEAVAAASNGELHPEAVVEAARDEGHPLHKHFLWDDVKAADLYRRDQARMIIRAIRIEPQERGDEPVRAFHSINDGGRSYRSFGEIAGSVSLQERLLTQADSELESFVRRHARMTDICLIITEARAKIAAKRKSPEDKHAAG